MSVDLQLATARCIKAARRKLAQFLVVGGCFCLLLRLSAPFPLLPASSAGVYLASGASGTFKSDKSPSFLAGNATALRDIINLHN